MRRSPSSPATFTRPSRRSQLTLALTALAVLALGACGTVNTTTGGDKAVHAEAAGSGQPDPSLAEIAEYIERTCPAPGALPEPPPSPEPAPPGTEIPADFVEPALPTTGPEVELTTRDWCASNLHEERVTGALSDLANPTPTKVRTILHDLGYTDERIHDLKQSGATTHFFLDLREHGGRLCLDGTVAGEDTVVDKCVAPATGPFTPGDRNR
ncbi:hypothetical protein [Streptomyces sp. SS]|uniref:hypothetical protein n=1 Tax=Streptomyces sp. SS TaxID=260742 RepID=UPI001ED9C010|nr:hypothetical protein [Streptomyces sp. SS]